MPEVKVVNVVKKYGKIYALDHVSLTIHDQEYFSLLGPSGCGKTTLLRLIAGLIDPDGGEIYIGNRRVDKDPPEDRDIGFVFQTFALFPHMTAWSNVLYGPKVKNYDAKQAETIGHEVLELVKLNERLNAYPSELSGGMMQRIAVARALAAGAKTLLLDEPLGQLDAKVRNDIRYEIRRMAKDLKLTAIHVTHDQAEAMSISDRIAVMKKGKIIQIGTPKELYMHPNSLFVAFFIGESNLVEGYITALEGKTASIELRQGLKINAINERDIKLNERVVLAIRPETCEMKSGHIKVENGLQGKIEKTTFEGTVVRYEVRLINGDRFVISRPSLAEEWVSIGQDVTITYPIEKAHLFPYPENGLSDEISV
ncbi:MAG: ABC transporter ATP-binding protein [Candidatus Bathyarchaeota archaeon]|nr:ABC transporter ATP-binding protein [Candidatus Bathyarchaeota archaeon]